MVVILACVVYDTVSSKYHALEKRFKGYKENELKEFEYEKSPLHTFAYGGTGTGKKNFVE